MALGGSSSLDCAVRLVTQAVRQDQARNYAEAARCYREAVILLRTAAASRACGRRARIAIEDKCLLYEARLRKLERHLLSRADLSKLFRRCVASELARSGENPPEGSSLLSVLTAPADRTDETRDFRRALETLDKAAAEDDRGRFAEALHFYELGAGELLDAVRKGKAGRGEASADAARARCLLVHDR